MGHARRELTSSFSESRFLTVEFNTSLVVYLTNVPTLENFALILFFHCFWSQTRSHVRRTFHVVGRFDENTSFRGTIFILLDPVETFRVLGMSAFLINSVGIG